jgi:hypothetical protein
MRAAREAGHAACGATRTDSGVAVWAIAPAIALTPGRHFVRRARPADGGSLMEVPPDASLDKGGAVW